MVPAFAVDRQPTKTKGLFRRRINSLIKKDDDKRDDIVDANDDSSVASGASSDLAGMVNIEVTTGAHRGRIGVHGQRSRSGVFQRTVGSTINLSQASGGQTEVQRYADIHNTEQTPVKSNRTGRPGVLERIRNASRSRSRTRTRACDQPQEIKTVIIAVTSCRSDGYHNQKAPGATSKLPRKAPANLKLFHELAVGLKDAYMAVGAIPERPVADEIGRITPNRKIPITETEFEARMVIWEFVGNLDFLLALVDEVAVDTATRGALKDDNTFRGLRDVIKKGNKVLETLLARRERKYTLFYRLPDVADVADIERMKVWNDKVENAVGAVTEVAPGVLDSESDDISWASGSTDSSSVSGRGNIIFKRGRQMLPSAGRVRARRATPTPRLRKQRSKKNEELNTVAAEDGYSVVNIPVTRGNLAMLQRSLEGEMPRSGALPNVLVIHSEAEGSKPQFSLAEPIEPKDELVDVIRGLRMEKIRSKDGAQDSDIAALKPNWRPKAEIPSAVPKLPAEYIHRHRLMKQVVNCLLDQNGAGPRDTDDEVLASTIITSITSRHSDKAGNGKTTLAVAAIQTVEVRERFSDGIAWIQLGKNALSDKDIRRLYEELYRQLISTDQTDLDDISDDNSNSTSQAKTEDSASRGSSFESAEGDDRRGTRKHRIVELAERRRRFHNGDLEGIKEDFGRLLINRQVLICLDDVWRPEDAKWFIFENPFTGAPLERALDRVGLDSPSYRVLITTRVPGILGSGIVQEVFVRILSEHEAVKLLLSSAGRRPYGGKNSTIFSQARSIVKGCGNCPLSVRLAGGMLRISARNWNIKSSAWASLIKQCRLNLEEASQLRSFGKSLARIVDLSFAAVDDIKFQVALRHCFLAFAMAFHDNDWVLSGKGIPRLVVLKLFSTVISSTVDGTKNEMSNSSEFVLSVLETMNLLQRARHGVCPTSVVSAKSPSSFTEQNNTSEQATIKESGWDESDDPIFLHLFEQSFVMHEALTVVAEEMSTRCSASFSPGVDEFMSVSRIVEEEKSNASDSYAWSAPPCFLTRPFANGFGDAKSFGLNDQQAHELLVLSLEGNDNRAQDQHIWKAMHDAKTSLAPGVDRLEEYIVTFLPTHLMRSKAITRVGGLLVDPVFINRRVACLGITEATTKQVADLLELRKLGGKSAGFHVRNEPNSPRRTAFIDQLEKLPRTPVIGDGPGSPGTDLNASTDDGEVIVCGDHVPVEVAAVLRDGSRLIIDAVYRVVNNSSGASDSLGMAMCLAAVGEGLLKGRQPRDAMLRLEEAVGIYRGLLGPYHFYVANSLHSVAKALVKLGESRVALIKFAEAARIYEACNSTLHFNAIANAQSLASLLVDVGEIEKAESMFEDVISMKKTVYGKDSVQVAKTINSYAILLAKHGRMPQALRNYEEAKAAFEAAPPPLLQDPESDIKCKYDVTLINLNIASILSKKGDLPRAVLCYEDGVRGLRQHEHATSQLHKPSGLSDTGKNTAHKHLVAALGRIGSLKLKLGDKYGALDAYMTLLREVDDASPVSSQTEKAKAHIKCATIYRQQEGEEAHLQSISHLRAALDKYAIIFGRDNKDTVAIASSLRQWLSEDRLDNGKMNDHADGVNQKSLRQWLSEDGFGHGK